MAMQCNEYQIHTFYILHDNNARDYETNKFSLEALRSEMQETEAVHIFQVLHRLSEQ